MAAKMLPDHAYLRECLDYDQQTGTLTWRKRPRAHFKNLRSYVAWRAYAGKPAGTISGRYFTVSINGDRFRAHRIIWKIKKRSDPPDEIDHINRDGFDNRWSNLRLATRRQNAYNCKPRPRQYPPGVEAKNGRYRVRLSLGIYDTVEAAHAAYCSAVRKIHGVHFNDQKEYM